MGVSKILINGKPIINLTNTDLVPAQAPVDSYFYQANGVRTQGSATDGAVLDLKNIEFTSNGTYNPSDLNCDGFNEVTVSVDLESELEGAATVCTITSDTEGFGAKTLEIKPDKGKFFKQVIVEPVGNNFIQIEENDINNVIKITENTFGEYLDVREFSLAEVEVQPNLETINKEISINVGESHVETIESGQEFDGIRSVNITCQTSGEKVEYYTTNLMASPSDQKQIFVPVEQDGKPGYYSDVTIQPIYSKELVVSKPGEYALENGYYSKVTVQHISNIESVNNSEDMDSKLVSDNIGKVFQYTGDSDIYATDGLYIVVKVDE